MMLWCMHELLWHCSYSNSCWYTSIFLLDGVQIIPKFLMWLLLHHSLQITVALMCSGVSERICSTQSIITWFLHTLKHCYEEYWYILDKTECVCVCLCVCVCVVDRLCSVKISILFFNFSYCLDTAVLVV